MIFKDLLEIVGDEPVFETGMLLAGEVDVADVRRQLSRWVRSGRLIRLRRGLYGLAPPYRKATPHPFHVAGRLVRPSYVSLQSVLAHYGMIPEYVARVTSVTTARPVRYDTPLGAFEYRHVLPRLLAGYRAVELSSNQRALIATPEKALLDLVYLTAEGDRTAYLGELRLQGLDRLDLDGLRRAAALFESPKIARAAGRIEALARRERADYEVLEL